MSRRGLGVRSQVDNDGPCRVEPLQGALRAAEVDLLHIPAVRLVAQAAADETTDMSRHALAVEKGSTCLKSSGPWRA